MIQLSKYVIQQQAEVIATLLRDNGSLRLYEGAQPLISTRTDGRLVECKISSVTVDNGTLTIKWDSGTAIKEGNAEYFRLCSKNIPVMSGKIGTKKENEDEDVEKDFEMEMPDRELKVGTIIDSGMLLHSVFKV